jgi:hypothetical protein
MKHLLGKHETAATLILDLLQPKWSNVNSHTGCSHCSMDSPTGLYRTGAAKLRVRRKGLVCIFALGEN